MQGVSFTIDPAYPWSIPRYGLLALIAVIVLIAGVTLWTYRSQIQIGRRRVAAILGLRLFALVLAVFTVLRPAAVIREDQRVPSTLILALDVSKSMAVTDEIDGKSRWATLQRVLSRSQPLLDELRDELNVRVVVHSFAEGVNDYSADALPIGKRTDFGRMLHELHQTYGQERALRGLLVLSDGADNGARYPALGEAARWRALGCPISTFVLGQQNTGQLRDVAVSAVTTEPTPVPVKGKLTVKATLDAAGFENAKVRLRLFLDDKEVAAHDELLQKTTGNSVTIIADAPATPGEVRLTLKADPLPGEATPANNEISTFVTVTREGLSVLLVDRLRWELKFIRRALASDPRVRLFEAVRQTDAPPPPGEADLFQFDHQAYDVIILGDLTARRLSAGNPATLRKIEELVREKGVGLLMIGGQDSFGNSDWRGTPIADLLPVEFDATGQVEEPVQMLPTAQGRGDYVMRLAPNPADNEALWRRLPALPGCTKLGRRKDGAVVLAESANRVPLLVRQQYGKGRTMALAMDTTYLWQQLGQPKSNEGIDLHARFWKQLALYLAQQEELEGSVWVRPDIRRVPAGGKVSFGVGVKGKTGFELTDGQFEVQVIGPDGQAPESISVARDKGGDRGTFWKTDKPGEYKLVARGKAKDADGKEVSGEATARFLVYQDDTEMLVQAAEHKFMERLAEAGGGKSHRADDMPKFLEALKKQPLAHGRHKPRYWPDWRASRLDAVPPIVFLVFVAALGLEWGLRRYWGMV